MSAKRLGLRDLDSTSLPDTDDQLEFTPAPVLVDGLNTSSIFASAGSRTTEEAAVLSAAAFATATEAIKGGQLSVFDTQLAALYYQASPLAGQMSAFTDSVGHSNAIHSIGGVQYVTIDAVAKDGDGAALLAQLQQLGLQHGASFGTIAGGSIDISKIPDLLSVTDLAFARESAMMTHVGNVTTQADSAQHADTARTTFSVSGGGIRVGVLCDSLNTKAARLTTMAQDIASNDLPADTTILDEGPAGATDEGRGMAQLVHDLAPGASIAFASAFNSFAGF